MQSKATSVAQYLAELPEDRRRAIAAVRQVILENLDEDYEEGMQSGMISYYVPHRVYPKGYHCNPAQPLPFVCLASQKNYMSLYLMCIYGNADHRQWFEQAWAKTGKKLDRGQSCVRFKKLEDVPLDIIGESIRRVPAGKYIAEVEACLEALKNRPKKGPPGKAAKAKGMKSAATRSTKPSRRRVAR